MFIYAAISCRFLDAAYYSPSLRDERLKQILEDDVEGNTPQSHLDVIYQKVLSFPVLHCTTAEKARYVSDLKEVLGVLLVLFEPASVATLARLTGVKTRDSVPGILDQLHSVVDGIRDETPAGLFGPPTLSPVHLSFSDFLFDEARSGEFHIDREEVHLVVAKRCLELLDGLGQDMCDLKLPDSRPSDVPRSELDRRISPELRYACRFWVRHLERLGDSGRKSAGVVDEGKVHVFLRTKFLFWLEALSLIGAMSLCSPAIDSLLRIVKVSKPIYCFILTHTNSDPTLSLCFLSCFGLG